MQIKNFSLSPNSAGRFGRVIITAKDGDDNLLRTKVWKELRLLDDIIQNTTVEYDGDTFSYREICARWEGECYTNDILNVDYILPEVTRRPIVVCRNAINFDLLGRERKPVIVMADHAEPCQLGR